MLDIPMEECHIGLFDVKMCQKVIHICKKQDNKVIQSYKMKEHKPTFTRGYETRHKKLHNNKH